MANGKSEDRQSGSVASRFRRHLYIYLAVVAPLGIVHFAMAPFFWWWWLALAWGALLTAHFLYVKSISVDDSWADRRAAKIHDRSYDVGHIDDIAKRHQSSSTDDGSEDRGRT